jgi:hypothetical protein
MRGQGGRGGQNGHMGQMGHFDFSWCAYIIYIIRCKVFGGKGRLGAVMKQDYFAMARLLYLKKRKDGLCI